MAILVLFCIIVVIFSPFIYVYLSTSYDLWKLRGKKRAKSKLTSNTTVQTDVLTTSDNASPSKFETKRAAWIKENTTNLLGSTQLTELLQTKELFSIGYSDMLKCTDWKFIRLKILVRDGYTCQDCKEVSARLHVHHKFYLKDKLPWEMDESGLISLCAKCHKLRHDKEKMPVYALINGKLLPTNNSIFCTRCNGAGYFPHFSHVEHGVCFKCGGNCIERTIFSEPLKKLKENRDLYNIEITLNEIRKFLNNISLKEFETKIYPLWEQNGDLPFDDFFFSDEIDDLGSIDSRTNKGKPDEIDDLPF